MQNLTSSRLLVLSLFLLGNSMAVAGIPTYNPDDLFIGFRTTGGKGATTDYLIDVGSATQFAAATNDLSLGNFGTDLVSLYGSSWYANTGVMWGAIAAAGVATTANGIKDTKNTIYASVGTAGVGVVGTPWTRASSSAQGGSPVIDVLAVANKFNGGQYSTTASTTNAIIQPTGDASSWATYQYGFGGNIAAFDFYPGSIESSFTGSDATNAVLDLFKMAPGVGATIGTDGTNLGYFTISDSGSITFIPESQANGGGNSYTGPWLWTGGSGAWSGTNNWQSNAPATNGVAVGITGAAGGTITNDAVSTISSLTYSNTAGAFTLTGSNIAVTGGITNNSTATQTIAAGIATTASQTINAATGNLAFTGGISNSASLTLQEGAQHQIAVNSAIAGTGNLIQAGAGTLLLTASNSYSGGTTLNGGTVVAGNSSAFGSGNIGVAANATLSAGTNLILGNAIGVNSGAVATLNNAGYSVAANGSISGQGGLALSGSGTTTLASSNSYAGGTTVNAGTLIVGNNSGFGTGAVNIASNATISSGVANLATTNAMSIATGVTATLNTAGNSWNQGGVINGAGGLAKTGNGVLSLSGSNSYTGATVVSGGTLNVTGSLASTGSVTVNSGATLKGTGSVGSVILNKGSTIVAGGSIGTLTLQSTIWNGGGSDNWKMADAAGAAGIGYDSLTIKGGLNLTGLSATNKFDINLWSLSSSSSLQNGLALNFNPNASTNWTLASVAGGITGFSTNDFLISTAAINGTGGFANGLNGSFGITTNASGLVLNYTTAFVVVTGSVWTNGSGNLSANAGITNGSALIFTGSGESVTNNAVSSLSSLVFSNTAGSYGLSGNAISLGAGGIVNNSTKAETISNALSLASTESFTAASGSLTLAGNVTNAGHTLTISGSNNTLLAGVESGAGGLTKSGAGTLIITGSQSFTGGTAITAGSILLSGGNNRLLTNGSVSVGAGALLNLGTNSQQLSSLSGSGTVTGTLGTLTLMPTNAGAFSGTLSGGDALALAGLGTLTLSGSNSYTGGTVVSGGTLVTSNRYALGGITNSLSVNGGTLNLGSQTIVQGVVTLTNGMLTNGTLSATRLNLQGGTVAASLTGSGGVTQVTGTSILSGSNSYTGGTVVAGGTLVASNATALAGGNIAVNGGTLNLSSVNQSVGALTLGNGTVTGAGGLSATSITVTNTGSALFSENLMGTEALTQNGNGTTTLTGSNSYSGGTVISHGTLVAASANALGSSNGSLFIDGGSLNLGGFNQRVGAATLTSGAIGNGTLTATKGYTINGTISISATLLGGAGSGLIKTGAGTLTLNTALPSGLVSIEQGALASSSSVIGAGSLTSGGVDLSSNTLWKNSGLLTVGGAGNGTLTVASGGTVSASGLLIASATNSSGTVSLGNANGGANLSLGSGPISFGSGKGNLILGESGQQVISNAISGRGTITSSGSGTTTLAANNSGFTGTNYVQSGAILVGAGSQLGGTINIAGKTGKVVLAQGASLTATNAVNAVAGTLIDNSGLAFTNSIRSSVVLSSTGDLQKTYAAGSSVVGFGAGIGAGKSFSILAGSVAQATTLDAHLVNGALDFRGTFSNPIVMGFTDPSFSAIKNTIQWYDTNGATSYWTNTIAGNTGNVIKTGYQGFNGSFNTFLLTDGINLNLGLSQIMGAYGYDSTDHQAWAVIDHNSIFDSSSADLPDLSGVTLNDAPIDIQAVPEPGTWALFALGTIVLALRISKRKVLE